MKCCICGTNMRSIDYIQCADEAIHVFEKPHKIKFEMTMLYKCSNCSHMQIEKRVNDEIYAEEYNVDYSSWKQMQDTNDNYFKKMVSLLENNDNILEVGCGDGRSLEQAKKYFKNIYGIEPAIKQAEIARKRFSDPNDVVITDFFTENSKLPKMFNAFYSKMVFEHLENPLEILKNVYNYLVPGAIGWLNVPNGQKIYSENLWQLFSFVHLQYYTPTSLTYMLNKTGFDIIEMDTHEDSEGEIYDIDVIIKKREKSCGQFSMQKEKDIQKIKELLAPLDKVTLWGAGTKSHKYAELFDSNINISHIVDSNSGKTGKYISGISIPIELVNGGIIAESNAIVILASMYNKEIIQELQKYKFHGKVFFFEKGNIQFIEMN